MSQGYQQPTGGTGQQPYGGQFERQPQQQQHQQGVGQTGTTRQFGQSHRSTHEQVGQQFESELTPELNEALESFDRVVEIAEWCADKCIQEGPQMAECARFCEDLAELASLNEKFIARDSINGPEIAETFLRVAQQGMPILQQHQQSPHVQETLQALDHAVDSTNRLLDSIGGQQMGGKQMGGQQMTGQQTSKRMGGQQTSKQPTGEQRLSQSY